METLHHSGPDINGSSSYSTNKTGHCHTRGSDSCGNVPLNVEIDRPEICVVHLIRRKNGIEPFRKFLNAYKTNPCGVPHDLLIIFKGFPSQKGIREYIPLLGSLPYKTIFVRDFGFDIRPYFKVARTFDYKYFCFLNSFCQPAGSDWLLKMYNQLRMPSVGVVGAAGSYQSHRSLSEKMLKTKINNLFLIIKRAYHWIFKPGNNIAKTKNSRLSFFVNLLKIPWKALKALSLVEWKALSLVEFWKQITWMVRFMNFRLYFCPFPNYHIRTNGFMISRKVMLKIRPGIILTKMDAWKFESGQKGFTRQILKMRLKPVVVGQDGRVYEKEVWYKSNTYFHGKQDNLLIKDNQTEMFRTAPPERQRQLMINCWGPENC